MAAGGSLQNMRGAAKWPADSVERVPLDKLIPYARNARTHSESQVAQLAASMREWGWTNPVLVDESGTIIAGHGRVMAARQLGFTEAPVMTARGWTDAQKRAYVIADNKLAMNADWDSEILAVEIDELRDAGFALDLLGFEKSELNDMIGTPNEAPADADSTDADATPPVAAVPISARGDVWLLGKHRVMCGDCRESADVDALIVGERINLAFTSPPYAEQRQYDEASGFKPIHPDAFVEWFAPVAANVARLLTPDGSWFVNIKPASIDLDTSLYVFDLVIAHVRQWGWHFATEFCWERNGVPKSVKRRFKNQFEPVYQFARGDWKMRPDEVRHESKEVPLAGGPGSGNSSWKNAQGNAPGGVVSSWRKGAGTKPGDYLGPGLAYPGNRLPTFSGSHEAFGHAAAFPVGLPQFFVNAYTDQGDTVFDPFAGTGSTLMAAQKTDRRGFAMEISPLYCDVIVRRWQAFTGHEATLLSDGRTFAEAERART